MLPKICTIGVVRQNLNDFLINEVKHRPADDVRHGNLALLML